MKLLPINNMFVLGDSYYVDLFSSLCRNQLLEKDFKTLAFMRV